MKLLGKLILLVLIPLLVATGITIYGYHRYQNYFVYRYYFDNVAYKATKEKIDKYIMFETDYYEELFEQEVKDENDKHLFDLVCYRWFTVDTDEDGKETKDMKYIFVIYNQNYGNMFNTMYDRDDKNNQFIGLLPYVRLTITNINDEEQTTDMKFFENTDYTTNLNGYSIFYDYNYVGYTKDDGTETKKYADGSTINSDTATKWAYYSPSSTYGTEVTLKFDIINSKYDYGYLDEYDEDELAEGTYTALELQRTDFYYNSRLLDAENGTYNEIELQKGYDRNIFDAGYNKYYFAKYMWWEALLAIVLTEIVTASTYFVWVSEMKQEQEREEKKKNK